MTSDGFGGVRIEFLSWGEGVHVTRHFMYSVHKPGEFGFHFLVGENFGEVCWY